MDKLISLLLRFFHWLWSLFQKKGRKPELLAEPDSQINVHPEYGNTAPSVVEVNGGVVSVDFEDAKVDVKPIKIYKMKVQPFDFPDNQYYRETTKKNQIVLHHTVSAPTNAKSVYDYWKLNAERVATHYVLQANGLFLQGFDDAYWGHHLGVKSDFLSSKGFKDSGIRNSVLNKSSISIEVCAWGGLIKGDGSTKKINGKDVLTKVGKFYNAYGSIIADTLEVEEVSWRGWKYFQRYTDEQVEALGAMLTELCKKHNIQVQGIVDGNFDISMDALSGVSGIYSHSNYRTDKSDLYPDKRIVQMLKNI